MCRERLADLERRKAAEQAPEPPSTEPVNVDPNDRTRWTPSTILHEYRDKPIQFISEVLGRTLDDQQEAIARDLAAHDNVAAKSGQKTGKTFLAVALAVWWVCTRPGARVLLTSASWEQVKDPLWVEVQALSEHLRMLGINILPEPALDPGTGIRFGDGRSIRGISTNKRERAAGKSGADQLFIIDEASGLKREIVEAFVGNTLGGGKVLALSQPTETSGFFYDCFTLLRDMWRCHTLSSRKTINYRQRREVIRGLARFEDVNKLIKAYGEGSPFVEVRVDGNFPTSSANTVCSLGMVEEALRRWASNDNDLEEGNTLDLGVDVARFGDDDSSVSARRGLRLFSPAWFEEQAAEPFKAVVNGYDYHAVAGLVVKCIRALRRKNERVRVKLDAAGGYGSAVAEILVKLRDEGETEGLDRNVQIIEVNVAEVSSDPTKYPKLRSEVWFGIRDFCEAGGALYPDALLEAELIAPHYKITPKGQLEVEKKEETKKRLGRSPDRADSALLAIYEDATFLLPPVKTAVPQSRWASSGGRGFG